MTKEEQETAPAADTPSVRIIGLGNPSRCDDGVGLVVARALASKNLSNALVIEQPGEGAVLSEAWKDAEVVFLIDAVSSGAAPGTVHRIDAHAQSLPTDFFRSSSHSFGLAESVELARAMHQLPPRLIVYGIEGKSFATGIGLSPEVVGAARRVVGGVARELRASRRRQGRAKPRVRPSAQA